MRIMFRIAWCSAQWSSHNPEAAGSSPAPAILLIPYGIRSYNTTKPNKVGLSVRQFTSFYVMILRKKTFKSVRWCSWLSPI